MPYKDPQKKKEHGQQYYKKNIEKIKIREKEQKKEFYLENKEKIDKQHRKYYLENKEKIDKQHRKYYLENKEKRKKYYERNKEKILRYQRNRVKTNINFKLAKNLRSRLRFAIKNNVKKGSAVKDLGCSIPELKAYLQNQFKKGMTWENWTYEGWHLDHIIPLDFFDLSNKEQLLKAVHYTNLQPMWGIENMRKSNKIL